SWGIYTAWDRNSKELPRIRKFTQTIPAELNIEFGYTLHITGAKGEQLEFVMKHPPFTDDNGNIRPDFTGVHFIPSNDWNFFLGDTIWAPESDKCGEWTLITYLQNKEIARKTFTIKKEDISEME
ncbi:MAG: DUF3859 domain-containing protein, partial [Bacteroidales bacterium]